VLNQNIDAERLAYDCDSDTELLLGTDYAMLRPEFQSWRGWQREIPEVARKVLVSMGGGDPDNVTLKVVQALRQTGISDLEARVVVGPANPHLEALRQATAHSTGIELLYDVTNMPELMAWADVAVSAGGSTCWELAFMGLPSVVLVLAQNQRGIAQGLDETGAAVNLGWHEDTSVEQIKNALFQLMRAPAVLGEMSRRGQELVDGDGVKRVAAKLRRVGITLRAMSADDCRLVWDWANEPETRASSFSPNPIP
jgi:spore coat polysaccharide biosynthesis predicted glycosyltransferase SpsG